MSDAGRSKRAHSRHYPADGIRKALEYARRIYEKDRFNDAPIAVTAQHMGFSGLNGGSRPALSALRKFGLVDYLGSGENLRVRLSDLAKRILLPKDDSELREAISESMRSPEIYQEILQRYPNWELPSEATLKNVLIRDFRLQEGAVKSFIADLTDSIEYERLHGIRESHGELHDADVPNSKAPDATSPPVSETRPPIVRTDDKGLIRLPMPGSSTYLMMPEVLGRAEASRILSWLKRVVTPAVEFAAEEPLSDEPK